MGASPAGSMLGRVMNTRLDFAKMDLMDALDLAVLIEFEAYKRYQMFTTQLGHRFPGDAASVFASMAENEAKHGQALEARRKARFGNTPRKVTLVDLYDVEAPEQGAVRSSMSAEQAFQLALESEQKARDFYDEALKHVADADIRALFSELRAEEVEHVKMVERIIAGLPAAARVEVEEDEDELPAL